MRRAPACNSSRSSFATGEGLPCHRDANGASGAKPGSASGRTFGDIFVLGIDTVRPIPKPLETYASIKSSELTSMPGNQSTPSFARPC